MKMGSPALTINVDHVLYGEDMEDIGRSHVVVENGVIREVSAGWVDNAKYSGGVALPLPINMHIHLSDYRAPDYFYGYSLSGYAGSKGLKHALINIFKEPLVSDELLQVLRQYSVVVDYQEQYWLCGEYRRILGENHVVYISLSRPISWDDDLEIVLKYCDGVGIPSPTIIPSWMGRILADISRKHIVSSHVSETTWMEEVGGLHYLLSNGVKLNHVVHGIYLSDWEYKILGDEDVSLVVCPRSNIWFQNKVADIDKAVYHGVNVVLGTDNAGVFHPDIWSDAYLLFIVKKIEPKSLIRFATVNGYKALGMKPSYIMEGFEANFMVIDLGLANHRSGDIYVSIVNRILWSRRRVIVKRDKLYIIEHDSGIM